VGKLAVVRVRGEPRSRGSVRDTLRMLGLTRVNHCVLVDDAPPVLGMLQETKDYITWGEARPELVEHLLRRRGRLAGNRRLTEEVVRASGFSSLGEFAEALCAGKADISSIPGLKRVFRLSPPRGGYRSTKRPFRDLGDLGYRGKAINELVLKMV
jgi:large subunit ribosomal protein L30